jgi:hypothetical protein
MLEGRSTPLKPLLILLPEVPFESHISTTKQTWAGEHPKVTMVFIWKLHIPEGATANHQWNKSHLWPFWNERFTLWISADALLVFTLHILLYSSRPASVKCHILWTLAKYWKIECPWVKSCLHLQPRWTSLGLNLFTVIQKLKKSWKWFWSYWNNSHLTPPW